MSVCVSMDKGKDSRDDRDIESCREERSALFSRLHDFRHGYDADKLIDDLAVYFDNEVDFNLDKIKSIITDGGKIQELVRRALKNNTHPVSELIQDIIRNSAVRD